MLKLRVPGRVLLLLCILYMIMYIDRVNLATAMPMIKAEFGLDNTHLGIIFSAFAYPYAIFQVFGGQLADRFGARRILVACCAISAAATLLVGAAGGLVSLFLCRLLLGIGEGSTFPAATRAMQSWVPTGRRGFAQGITHSFSRFGNAITPPIVAGLALLGGWRLPFVVLGAASLVWVIVWMIYFRDNPSDHKGMTEEDLARLPVYVDKSKQTVSQRKVPWGPLVRRMMPVTLTYFCYGWSLWLFLNWMPSFFLEGYGLNITKSAVFASGVFWAGVIGDTLGGVISDAIKERTGNVRLARTSVIVIGFLGASACLGTVLQFRDVHIIGLLLSGGFFFLELIIGPVWSVPMDIAPQHAGAAAGLMNTGMGVAGIISPLVFGYLVDMTGSWFYPFMASVALLLIGACLCLTMHPERPFVTAREADLGTNVVTTG